MPGKKHVPQQHDDEFPTHETEIVEFATLKPHPQNYRFHPPEQLEHIKQSIRENGFYRNVVIAQDNTILAGHGVVKAALELKGPIVRGPVIRLAIDPQSPRALKLVAGDNEIARLGIVNDHALAELLKIIRAGDANGLRGTGFDDTALENLVAFTQQHDNAEIQDHPPASLNPEAQDFDAGLRITIHFRTLGDRRAFLALCGIPEQLGRRTRIWWPEAATSDPA